MEKHEQYMQRCLQLARLGEGNVAPNPMVGAVLVYNERIIGEGYHQQFGEAHAEVNCINNVKEADKQFISSSTMYVSLEPCAHYGKTPPCADLLIEHSISEVVVGCSDPFKKVDGKGIEKLRNAGVNVTVGILQDECLALNKRFFLFHTSQRPYIILKWAQSKNGMIAKRDGSRVFISNEFSNRLVHKWRSEEAGIMVGTNTALNDDPQLNTRLWTGRDPVRMVVDLNLRLPVSLKLFDNSVRTIVFNYLKHEENDNVIYYKLKQNGSLISEVLKACYLLHIQSVIIEGGAKLLATFIEQGLWDEARVIENTELIIKEGLAAPVLTQQTILGTEHLFSDTITYYKRAHA